MNSKYCFIGLLLLVCNLGHTQELEECLEVYWGVDHYTAAYLRNKFDPLLIGDFIEKSKKLKIDFSIDRKLLPPHPEDGIFQSPKQHLVLFENPFVRILFSSTESMEREPFHRHVWKSLMVIIKPTTYEIEYADGSKEITFLPIGVYELPADEYYACTNLGETADECLRFEIKD